MKKIFGIIMLLMPALPCMPDALSQFPKRDKVERCKFRGKKLYGRVRVVTVSPDFRVRVVTVSPDLNVEKVDVYPSECGRWQFVDVAEDFTVQFVDVAEDFTVRYVTVSPGMP